MASVSLDGKCRIWRLRHKSAVFEVVPNDRVCHNTNLFAISSVDQFQMQLYRSRSREIDDEEFMARALSESDPMRSNDRISHSSKFLYSSMGSAPSIASADAAPLKSQRKDLRFQLTHEIKVSES